MGRWVIWGTRNELQKKEHKDYETFSSFVHMHAHTASFEL